MPPMGSFPASRYQNGGKGTTFLSITCAVLVAPFLALMSPYTGGSFKDEGRLQMYRQDDRGQFYSPLLPLETHINGNLGPSYS